MALRDTVRNPLAFAQLNLNTNLHDDVWNGKAAPALKLAPASVLVRTVSLLGLTHREHIDANLLGGARNTNDMLRLFYNNDYLFVFSNKGQPFPNIIAKNDSIGKLATIMANGELNPNLIAGNMPTPNHYVTSFNPAIGAPPLVLGGAVPGVLPNFANPADVNSALIFADYNDTVLRLNGGAARVILNANVMDGAPPPVGAVAGAPGVVVGGAVINFVDKVNATHNIHKKLLWNNIETVRNREQLALNAVIVSVPNSKGATSIKITTRGNFGRTYVENWGKYSGPDAKTPLTPALTLANARIANAVMRFMWGLNPAIGAALPAAPGAALPINQASVVQDAELFADWHLLECIRDPAALITNAMFFTLAANNGAAGYRGFGEEYSFIDIRTKMPMAPSGTVASCRSLWRALMWSRRATLPIYYLYDYATNLGNFDNLELLENNLLFNYITWKAGIPDISNIFGAAVVRANQIGRLTNAAPLPAGVVALPQPFAQVLANPNTYLFTNNQVNPLLAAGVAWNVIQIEARFPNVAGVAGGAGVAGVNPLTIDQIIITRFPLRLIFDLLNQWYNVDLGVANPVLANLQIDFGLSLR